VVPERCDAGASWRSDCSQGKKVGSRSVEPIAGPTPSAVRPFDGHLLGDAGRSHRLDKIADKRAPALHIRESESESHADTGQDHHCADYANRSTHRLTPQLVAPGGLSQRMPQETQRSNQNSHDDAPVRCRQRPGNSIGRIGEIASCGGAMEEYRQEEKSGAKDEICADDLKCRLTFDATPEDQTDAY
jgi:hypothetical protein